MSEYTDISVFIFGAGGRQALPVCKGFYQLHCKVINYCYSKWDTGYLTKYKTEKILYNKDNSLGLGFFEYGLSLIQNNQYSLVVPLSDDTAIYLSQHKSEISNTRIAVNDWDTLLYAIDKAKTMQVCADNNISAPKTIAGEDIIDSVEHSELEYPLVVKPRRGVGSIGFNIFYSKEDLQNYLHNVDNKTLLVQEFIKQGNNPQYRADLFRTKNGELKAACVGKVTRWYPIDGGSGICIVSVHDDQIVEACKKLLDAINWIGYANIDMVYDDCSKEIKILEINGRTGASIKIDYICGINISQLILENEMDIPVTDMLQYEDGKMMTCLLPDLLWLLKTKNRQKTDPSWFKRKKMKDAIFSWDDPMPSVGFVLESIKNFIPAMKKRKRV